MRSCSEQGANRTAIVIASLCTSGMVASSALADELIVPSTEYPDIASAVAAAAAGDEIVLLDGELTGAGNWNVTIGVPLTIRSASGSADAINVRGPGDAFPLPNDRFITIEADVVIEHVTMSGFTGDVGAAIRVQSGTVTIDGCVFEDNITGDDDGCQDRLGGAIAVLGGAVTISDSQFIDNISVHPACAGTGSAQGGAISVEGGEVIIRRSAFEGNRTIGVLDGLGGAIYARRGTLTIDACTFTNNSVTGDFAAGGAVGVSGDATLQASHSTFISNTAGSASGSFSDGGAISTRGDATLVGLTIQGNRALADLEAAGGGISSVGVLDAANVILRDNRADGDSSCDPSFLLYGRGGAMFVRGPSVLSHVTIVDNGATCDGAGLFVSRLGGSLTVANSVIRDDVLGEVPVDITYSNVAGGFPGEGNIDAEPLFDADLRLLAGSPGIDAGSTALLPADVLDVDGDGDPSEPLPLDLFGNPRRVDDPDTSDTGQGPAPIPDMGAHEFGEVCPADFDGDGELTIFDFLAFQNAFDAGDLRADFDGDGVLTLFDFLAFQNAFDAGCE